MKFSKYASSALHTGGGLEMGEDRGTVARRLPPEPAPADVPTEERWTAHPDDLIESAWGLIANAGGGDWTKESDEWRAAAERWRERYHAALDAGDVPVGPRLQAGTSSATIGDVEKVARRLELVYVPEQHRLHASPDEECNTDASSGKRKIREEDLAKVSPDVSLCKHCVSEEEARIIRAGLRRT